MTIRHRHQRGRKTVVERLARGFLDADLGHRAGDHQRADAQRTELAGKARVMESAVAVFFDHEITGRGAQFVDDLGALQKPIGVAVAPFGGPSSTSSPAAGIAATSSTAASPRDGR